MAATTEDIKRMPTCKAESDGSNRSPRGRSTHTRRDGEFSSGPDRPATVSVASVVTYTRGRSVLSTCSET